MSNDLPIVEHFEDFYIWFNKEEKQEYYSTPLYFYKADFSMGINNKKKKTEKLVENKEQYFLITRDYKRNQHIQNIEKHINKSLELLIKTKMIKTKKRI